MMISKSKLTVCLAVALASCSPKIYPSVNTESKDSVRVEIHERIDTVITTITIEKEVERIVTRDTSSHLENKYALSDVKVSGGHLYHSLETKPQEIKKPTIITVRDTLYFESSNNNTVTTETIEVERNFTHWESFLLVCGYILLAELAIIIIFVAIKLLARK